MFKVGDIIKGISDEYSITNKRMHKAKVTRVNYDNIDIKILEHEEHRYKGDTFHGLEAKYFALVDEVKFKIGDIITGTSNNPYGETTEEMTRGKVIDVRDNYEDIKVEILEHECEDYIGNEWWVASKYFKLVEEKEEKRDFKVGDRVRCVKKFDPVKVGYTGTIVRVTGMIGVEWDNLTKGHSCDGSCADGKGYYMWEDQIELIQEEFKVGDRVQFKSWEELAKEYKKSGCSIIIKAEGKETEIYFNKSMKHLCGTYATIRKIDKPFIHLKDFTTTGNTYWNYVKEMLKPVKTPQNPREKPQETPQNELSEQEIKILSRTNKKWIARDNNGLLFMYQEQPVKDIGGQQWYSTKPYEEVKKNLFEQIKWENSPQEIKKLKEN